MADQKKPDTQVVWHQVAVLERFSSVLYPLDLFELLRELPTIGYVVPDLVLRGTPEAGKPIATKGAVELAFNQENKTIGIKGRDIEGTLGAFRELREFYLERLDPSPGLRTHYLELDARGWAKSDSNPTEVCSRFWAGHSGLRALHKILGSEATNFGLQLVPPNKDPNDPDWFHICIEPPVASSKRYSVRWIWRGSDAENLLQKFAKVGETLQSLISVLES